MISEPQEIRRGRKFDQVLEGARTIFLRDGFEGASVDDIARAAGVSKATLYSYFPDKRLLFLEITRIECERQADEAEAFINDNSPVDQVLRQAAERIVAFMMSDLGKRALRLCVAESERFPTIGAVFYETGPGMIRERLGNYLRKAIARDELAIDDVDLAAEQFSHLCKAGVFDGLMFNRAELLTPEQVARTVNGAVSMFMARYRKPAP
ncbi:MAG: TetR/AcrR family transcriptional regulator [Rhodobacteraceae bacterium]|nr:TetR/AcrR family transcriptional regulator [Paracoccaceae bacterium]